MFIFVWLSRRYWCLFKVTQLTLRISRKNMKATNAVSVISCGNIMCVPYWPYRDCRGSLGGKETWDSIFFLMLLHFLHLFISQYLSEKVILCDFSRFRSAALSFRRWRLNCPRPVFVVTSIRFFIMLAVWRVFWCCQLNHEVFKNFVV